MKKIQWKNEGRRKKVKKIEGINENWKEMGGKVKKMRGEKGRKWERKWEEREENGGEEMKIEGRRGANSRGKMKENGGESEEN